VAIIEYINQQETQGKLFLTQKLLREALSTSISALSVQIHRLKKAGRLVSLGSGCYVIVPLLYRQMGAPPIEWYLDDYMNFLKIKYYAGLLTAAEYHGSSHQSPQVYQIIADKRRHPIVVGRTHITFIYKNARDFNQHTIIQQLTTRYGYINLSSPESTALDLLIYQKSTGSLNNIATVITELAPKINGNVLRKLVKQVPSTYSQRLGYILEKIETPLVKSIVKSIAESLKGKNLRYRLLQPGINHSKTDIKNPKWHLIINTQLEVVNSGAIIHH
jgi:predicted transcriptional regulator of viral defense system